MYTKHVNSCFASLKVHNLKVTIVGDILYMLWQIINRDSQPWTGGVGKASSEEMGPELNLAGSLLKTVFDAIKWLLMNYIFPN